LDGVLVSGRDGVRADAAVGRRQVDGEPGGGDDALVVVRALPDVTLDERRGGRGVGHGARVGRVAAVGRGLPAGASAAAAASSAATDLSAVRAGFRGRAGEVFAVSVRVGERRAAGRRGDVTARVAAAAGQHGRRGVLLVLVRVGRRRAAVRVLSGHGGEYVRAVHGFQAVRRGDQFDGRRRRVHLGDQRRRGRRRAVYRPAVVLRRMVAGAVLFFHVAHLHDYAAAVVVVIVVGLLTVVVVVVVVDHVHHLELLLVLLLLLHAVTGRDQHDFGTSRSSADGLQPVRIAAALVVRPAAVVMAQVLRLALQRLLLVQEQSLQVAQVSRADFQSTGTGPDQPVGRFQLRRQQRTVRR